MPHDPLLDKMVDSDLEFYREMQDKKQREIRWPDSLDVDLDLLESIADACSDD